jgi:hypothetical protein
MSYRDINTLDRHIKCAAFNSELAQTFLSILSFGDTSAAEPAGEIDTIARFETEAAWLCMPAWRRSTTVRARAAVRE